MPTFGDLGAPLDSVAGIIRMALTPVFLLLSIANLLNVFSTRLALVGDRADQVAKTLDAADPDQTAILRHQLIGLYRRSVTLDVAVILSAIAKAAICIAVLLLFVGALGGESVGWALLVAFGSAIVCTLGAILAYATEMLMAGTGIRTELADGERRHLIDFIHRSRTET
jgi:hypothetical protein